MLLLFAVEYLSKGSIWWFTEIIFFRHKPQSLALTFDDGPDPKFTPQILQVLKEHKIQATFFVCGKESAQQPELIKQILAEGHEIGNHGWHHLNMVFKSPAKIRSEIAKTDQLLKELGVEEPIHFRPPFTRMFLITPMIAAQMQKKIFLWNIASKDYKAKSVSQIVQNVRQGSAKGGIIVMHDGRADRQKSVDALKIIIPELLKRNFRFQTCSQYLKPGRLSSSKST